MKLCPCGRNNRKVLFIEDKCEYCHNKVQEEVRRIVEAKEKKKPRRKRINPIPANEYLCNKHGLLPADRFYIRIDGYMDCRECVLERVKLWQQRNPNRKTRHTILKEYLKNYKD